jgi:hypothetical protein
MKLGIHTPQDGIRDIMFSARHKSLKGVENYQKDALGHLETAMIHNDPVEHVSHWRSMWRENDTNLKSLNARTIPYQKPLVKLAEAFI